MDGVADDDAPWWYFDCRCCRDWSMDVLLPPRCWLRDGVSIEPVEAPKEFVGEDPLAQWRTKEKLDPFDITIPASMTFTELLETVEAFDRYFLYSLEMNQIEQAAKWFTVCRSIRRYRENTTPNMLAAEKRYSAEEAKLKKIRDILDQAGTRSVLR